MAATRKPLVLNEAEMEEANRIAANRHLTSYPEARVLALAEHAAELGIVCHIDGFPFGRKSVAAKDQPHG